MASLADIDKIEDEDVLDSLINQTEDLNIRRNIRRRQKELREKRQASYEASKAGNKETAGEMRLRMAAEEKARKMNEFAAKAKEQKEGGASEDAARERRQRAEEEKQRKMEQYKEQAKGQSSMYNAGVADVLKNKDDPAPVKVLGPAPKVQGPAGPLGGGTSYGPKAGAQPAAAGASKVVRNPSGVKEMLLEWCKKQCEGYEHVSITNFSTSWADGMAFCALIHHFCPTCFDYAKLNPKNRRGNFTLAFKVAEKEADIAPLLDVEDMVRMKTPDWKCVFTYVQGFYRRFGMPQKAAP